MSERHKLHPVYILVGMLQAIRGFLPFIIIALLKGVEWSELHWYWFAGAALISVIILLFSYLEWKRFGFWLEEDRIIIRKGLLFRDEKTIYFSRIHSVNVEQPLVQRLLGVAQVKIETPGGNKKADGILPALSLSAANDIQRLLKGQADNKVKPGSLSDKMPDKEKERLADAEWLHKQSAPAAQSVKVLKPTDDGADALVRLDSLQLLQAAGTSMNFGLVLAFIAGLYSIANDFIEELLPDHFLETVVEDSTSLMPGYLFIGGIIVAGLLFAWLLSILLYVLKYSGFTAKRLGKQISVSYGLLEKKTLLFDPQKVQAAIVNESLLRQAFGYAQIELQVISSDKKERLMLHPFVKHADIAKILSDFVPQLNFAASESFAGAPKRALLYYVRNELLLTIVVCLALILFFDGIGFWSLLLIPLVVWWRKACHHAAGIQLEAGQLTLRNRFVSRTTYLIRRPKIVSMRVRRSIGQKRKKLLTLSVHAMGSPFAYSVSCLDEADVKPVWKWYSQSYK